MINENIINSESLNNESLIESISNTNNKENKNIKYEINDFSNSLEIDKQNFLNNEISKEYEEYHESKSSFKESIENIKDFENLIDNNENKKIKRKYIKNKCNNEICNQKNNYKLYKIKFQEEENMYCESCAKSLKKKWACLFCNFIFTDTDIDLCNDFREWIKCDNTKCGRWIHSECEEQFGIKTIRDLNCDSYKYFCPECRNEKIDINKEETKKKETEKRKNPFFTINDIKKIMMNKKKSIVKSYTNINYVYSDNYLGIEKLFSNSGYSLQLTETELFEDFNSINKDLSLELFTKSDLLLPKSKSIKKENISN